MKSSLVSIVALAAFLVAPAGARALAGGGDSVSTIAATAVHDSAAAFVAPPAPDPRSLDVRAFQFLNGRLANPVFDAVMPFVTDLNRWRIVILLAWAGLVLFGRAKGRWAALMLIPLIAASDQIASSVVKPLVERMRPCEVLGGVHLWYGPEGWITTPAEVARSYKSSFAFPSSHATNITASMLFIGLAYRRVLAPLAALAILVGFSRIYIGVHWPSDVLAGAAIGAALACIAFIMFRKIYPRTREDIPARRIP
jgi:undecaprenyl-diphosphatase